MDETDGRNDDASGTTFGDVVLGLAGLSLLRNWYEADASDRRARLIEIARDYERNTLLQLPVPVTERATIDGYARWAEEYDAPGNSMTAIEQPTMAERALAYFERGATALDAGCGTGRLAAELCSIGYETTGVDVTAEMLTVAEKRVPDAEFRLGSFDELPVADSSVDVVVSGLAVCHSDDLDTVFAEFARVLRSGGHVVMSNPHPFTSSAGGQAFFADDGGMSFVRNHPHHVGSYINALLANGFQLKVVDEICYDATAIATNPAASVWPDVVTGGFLGQPFVLVIEAALV